jgi:hypothetical protein
MTERVVVIEDSTVLQMLVAAVPATALVALAGT